MADTLEQTSENKPERDDKGRLLPGNTANPAGRPKGSVSITEAIRRKLEETYPVQVCNCSCHETTDENPDGSDLPCASCSDLHVSNEEKRTYLEKIVETIFHNAIKVKDARSLKDVWAYIDGLPKQNIGISADKEDLAAMTEFFRSIAKKKDE